MCTFRFILKTKEQRAAEKALLDKSPLKTLTLEDFLESERHKLTGTLTPVTPESFAKWKKERMDKKAAEEQARKAKDNTGRALFESGKWRDDESEAESDDEDDPWNLEKLRRETEALRQKKEEQRLQTLHDGTLPTAADDTPEGADEDNSAGETGESGGDVTGEASPAAQAGQEVPAA
jgi:hypothetical protein